MDSIAQLNAPTAAERLAAARSLADKAPRAGGRDVNNHIHTTYSFSPYSPSMVVWKALEAGLCTAGLMDHDSVGGAREFLTAAEMMRLPVTVGMECRVSFARTPFAERRLNNTDQRGIAYIAMHGIPHNRLDAMERWIRPYREARFVRNRAMTEKLNALLPGALRLDYLRDVEPLSQASDGGTVTERHLLYALSHKVITVAGGELTGFLRRVLGLSLSEKQAAQLGNPDNPFLAYDLLGVLKADFMERFYIAATDECPDIAEAGAVARENGVILAYPYLGDVGDSVTGDKKAQAFEDAYLDELFANLRPLGFNAVTYMPTRNTAGQLSRLQELCKSFGFFEICGEDINAPHQNFLCEALRQPQFSHLYDATWALIGHELCAEKESGGGMFSNEAEKHMPDMGERVKAYRDAALRIYGVDCGGCK